MVPVQIHQVSQLCNRFFQSWPSYERTEKRQALKVQTVHPQRATGKETSQAPTERQTAEIKNYPFLEKETSFEIS